MNTMKKTKISKTHKLRKLLRKHYKLVKLPTENERQIQIQFLFDKIKTYSKCSLLKAASSESRRATGLYEMHIKLILLTGEL